MSSLEKIIQIPNELILNIFGEFDTHVKKIEKVLGVHITNRENGIKIVGEGENVNKSERVLSQLADTARRGIEISTQNVDYLLSLVFDNKEKEVSKLNEDYVCMTPAGKYIRPKTLGQKKYIDLIRNKMIVFGAGPAGTGKTYLAMAHAITAFKNNEVNRIILTRPAIEAGEKLGFLPGDLQSKIDPYLRPLYDALYEIMGVEAYIKNKERGLIEVAPLAYMRGRTLDNCFIVLDEAQNTTPAQMKMFLTRIGFGSKAVITGDLTQKDLPSSSGLEVAMRVLKNVDDIGFSKLTNKDVVRHPLVQKIVKAYENYENRKTKADKTKNK